MSEVSQAVGNTARGVARTTTNGPTDGQLVVRGGGAFYSGWETVSVTRSLSSVPSVFDIDGTARYRGRVMDVLGVNMPVTIEIGGQTVLTGYVDAAAASIEAEAHGFRFHGRGRLRDAVDCSAIVPSMTMNNVNVVQAAETMLAPFAGPIKVIALDGPGDNKPLFISINPGETVYEVIERIARYEGLLVYENADGNLVLARVGKVEHSSGFYEGKNIQSAEFVTDFSQRFSKYTALVVSQDMLARTGFVGPTATDPGVQTYRPMILVSEQSGNSAILAQQRANWEANRRRGRSMRVTLVADSWLDSSGTPWTPNQVAPVGIPSVGLLAPDWVITDVTYRRDGRSGTNSQITLMPPEALALEPITLNPYENRALTGGPGDDETPTGPAGPPSSGVTAPNAGDGRRDRDSYTSLGTPGDGRRDRG